MGLVGGIADQAGMIALIALIVLIFYRCMLALRWCYLDAEQRNVRLWRNIGVLMIAFPGPLFTMPAYLLKSRGKQGVVSCLWFYGFVMIVISVDVIGFCFAAWITSQ